VRVTSRERSEASALYAAPVRPIRHFHVTRHIAFVVAVDDIQRTLYPGKNYLLLFPWGGAILGRYIKNDGQASALISSYCAELSTRE
jgi:hypothetical protein